MAKRKKNYLNNKDMLKQIHLSKVSYCSFLDPLTDSQQDYIVDNIHEIFGKQNVIVGKDEEGNPIYDDVPTIDLAKEARASRLTKLEIPTAPEDVDIEDVVWRVMTTEHIPLVPKKKAKKKPAKTTPKVADLFDELTEDDDGGEVWDGLKVPDTEVVEMVPMRAGFPPFFHYRIFDLKKHGFAESTDKNNPCGLTLVGKSHWKGTLEDGEFCKDHGKTTDTLALMYMKLCERYATRSNWRGYTYNDEMRGQALLQLSQIGLQFNEAKSQNPFAYYTAAVTNSFTRILNIEKKMQNIRDDILEANGLTPSWTRQFANDNSDQKYIDNPND